jgi:hypothetical protein
MELVGSLVIGGFIAWLVTHLYHLRGSRDLRDGNRDLRDRLAEAEQRLHEAVAQGAAEHRDAEAVLKRFSTILLEAQEEDGKVKLTRDEAGEIIGRIGKIIGIEGNIRLTTPRIHGSATVMPAKPAPDASAPEPDDTK